MGKLSVKASVEGTEEAMVVVLTVVVCYNDVEDKKN
jgi:hypothetical protein